MVQVGLIRVDGRKMGTVTFTVGPPDAAVVDADEDFGYEHEGRDWQADLGLRPSHGTEGHRGQITHGDKASVRDRATHRTTRTSSAADDAVGEGLSGSSYLAARRERFAQEMRDDPALRERVAAMVVTEGARDPVPVVESLMNRMDYSGGTLRSGLSPSFYGPMRRGELPAAQAQLHANPELNRRMNRAIDEALGGSNLIRGATDQGLPTDPNGQWQEGRIVRGGNVFNDWGGGPGGHAGARAYRERTMQRVNQEANVPANVTEIQPP